jgi:hypothetical protein
MEFGDEDTAKMQYALSGIEICRRALSFDLENSVGRWVNERDPEI